MRFIGFGMVTLIGRRLGLPHLGENKRPLCQLLREDVEWAGSREHDDPVRCIKALLTSAPVLFYFDPH